MMNDWRVPATLCLILAVLALPLSLVSGWVGGKLADKWCDWEEKQYNAAERIVFIKTFKLSSKKAFGFAFCVYRKKGEDDN